MEKRRASASRRAGSGSAGREASDLAGEALQIDVDEKRAHDNVWKKRGTVLTRIKNVLREIDTDVSAIVEAPSTGPDAGAKVLHPAAFRVTSND